MSVTAPVSVGVRDESRASGRGRRSSRVVTELRSGRRDVGGDVYRTGRGGTEWPHARSELLNRREHGCGQRRERARAARTRGSGRAGIVVHGAVLWRRLLRRARACAVHSDHSGHVVHHHGPCSAIIGHLGDTARGHKRTLCQERQYHGRRQATARPAKPWSATELRWQGRHVESRGRYATEAGSGRPRGQQRRTDDIVGAYLTRSHALHDCCVVAAVLGPLHDKGAPHGSAASRTGCYGDSWRLGWSLIVTANARASPTRRASNDLLRSALASRQWPSTLAAVPS